MLNYDWRVSVTGAATYEVRPQERLHIVAAITPQILLSDKLIFVFMTFNMHHSFTISLHI